MKQSSPRRDQVIKLLKNRLAKGIYKPGKKLPSYRELENELKVSRGTLRQAINELKRQEFLTTVDRSGIYASEHQPFACCFGLVFRYAPDSSHWNCFYDNILSEIDKFKHRAGIKIKVFFNISPHLQNHEFITLQNELKGLQIGGLIFTEELFEYVKKYFLEIKPNLRHVYIFGKPEQKQSPSVDVDNHQLWERGLGYLRHLGCRRLAVIDKLSGIDYLLQSQAGSGSDLPEKWMVSAPEERSEIVKNLIHLLFDYPGEHRPDGLFVGNDNFLPTILAALREVGIIPGKDVHLAAHCNWPNHRERHYEVKQIGFNTHQILEHCLEALLLPRVLVPDYYYTPARFDHEIQLSDN